MIFRISYIDYPLSRFPQGGKAGTTPSPLGEVPMAIGREGGKYYKL